MKKKNILPEETFLYWDDSGEPSLLQCSKESEAVTMGQKLILGKYKLIDTLEVTGIASVVKVKK